MNKSSFSKIFIPIRTVGFVIPGELTLFARISKKDLETFLNAVLLTDNIYTSYKYNIYIEAKRYNEMYEKINKKFEDLLDLDPNDKSLNFEKNYYLKMAEMIGYLKEVDSLSDLSFFENSSIIDSIQKEFFGYKERFNISKNVIKSLFEYKQFTEKNLSLIKEVITPLRLYEANRSHEIIPVSNDTIRIYLQKWKKENMYSNSLIKNRDERVEMFKEKEWGVINEVLNDITDSFSGKYNDKQEDNLLYKIRERKIEQLNSKGLSNYSSNKKAEREVISTYKERN